jgi:toxin YoeB
MKDVIFRGNSLTQLFEWGIEDPKKHQKIGELIQDIHRNPFQGLGKPEPLKYDFKGWWSRRIDDEHRLIYRVSDEAITIVSCKYHYKKL